jgi:hypothetical protein
MLLAHKRNLELRKGTEERSGTLFDAQSSPSSPSGLIRRDEESPFGVWDCTCCGAPVAKP